MKYARMKYSELKIKRANNENQLKTLNSEFTKNETKKILNQTEIILSERTKDRDAYVAQIRIFEDQMIEEVNEKNSFKFQID